MNKILEQAIEKAVAGGWKADYKVTVSFSKSGESTITQGNYAQIIFNHDFAKALWGDEYYHETFIVPKELNKRFTGARFLDVKPVWQYHLQNMVLADDPIAYLGENI